MKHVAFALVLLATTSSANADSADSSSLLRCGVMFGGKSLTYDAGAETNNKKAQHFNTLPQTSGAEPLRFAPSAAAVADGAADAMPAASNTSDSRLPAKLTLATVGCSW
jgi:hypothetical protein